MDLEGPFIETFLSLMKIIGVKGIRDQRNCFFGYFNFSEAVMAQVVKRLTMF